MTAKFNVQFLEDAAEFLDALEPKDREKVLSTIRKAQILNDKELFKKLTEDIWEFRTLYNKTTTGSLHSGTKLIKRRPW